MPEKGKSSVSYTTTMQAGFASSILTFAIRWVPDCVVNRRIVDSSIANSWRSFANIGIAWDLAYRIPANTFGFPAQYHLKEAWLQNLDERYQTRTNKVIIHGVTGVVTAVTEAALFYPFDTMRTLAQTKPGVFQGHSVRYFFRNQPLLRRGLGLTIGRNTLTNAVAWPAKAMAELSLEQTNLSLELQTMFAAFIFAMTRILIGYPITTINLLIQTDTDHSVAKTAREKCHYALTLTNQRLKTKGISSFYQGFAIKGGAQILTVALQMWLFNWWIHPKRAPLTMAGFWKKEPADTKENSPGNTYENRR